MSSENKTPEGRQFDSALEIEEFEDVSLLLKQPIKSTRGSWWRGISSTLLDFFRLSSTRRGFQPLSTDDKAPSRQPGRWCPEEEAGFLSRHSYAYMNSLIDLGMQKHLEQDDLWDLAESDETENSTATFKKSLQRSKDAVHRPNGSVFRALLWSFGRLFLFAGLVKVIHDGLQVLGPEFLRQLLRHLRDAKSSTYYGEGVGWAVAMFAASAGQTLLINYYFHILYRLSLHIKSSLVHMLYRKSLRITTAARSEYGVGKIVNLQSNDASKLWDMVLFLHVIWSGPLQIFLVLFQLISILGWLSALGGLIVIIALIPITTVISKFLGKLRKEQMIHTDARIKATSEVVTGIKAIKLYAWEDAYIKRILELRETELKKILKIGFLRAFSRITYMITPILVSGVAFGLHIVQGHQLTADNAFPALAYFNLLRFPITMLPLQINNIINGHVALKRIQAFMDSEEMKEDTGGMSTFSIGLLCLSGGVVSGDDGSKMAVSVSGATFSWPPNPTAMLSAIGFELQRGKLLQIVGDVGSGKSSLLSALLGEMKRHDGNVQLNGSLAYTSQEPWIQNRTLRENVLFGKEMNEFLYAEVMDACALLQDLDALPGGDQTEIGEKGVNLSGGQKHRVALARACYADSDVYLLDDPLSAVDAHVGRHLFEKCICGLLAGKTRILVSHQLQFLPRADTIIVMKMGQIAEMGTYDELKEKGVQFSEFELQHETGDTAAALNRSNSDDSNEDCNNRPTDIGKVDESKAEEIPVLRTTSLSKLQSMEAKKKGKLTDAEERSVGHVKRNVYVSYIKSWGPLFLLPILLISFAVADKGLGVTQNWWLSVWTNHVAEAQENGADGVSSSFYITIYYLFGGAAIVFQFLSTTTVIIGSINASRRLYNQLILKVSSLPMSFFDSQPTGRLLNRFTKDTESMDTEVSGILAMALSCVVSVTMSMIIVTAVTKVVIFAILILAIAYVRVRKQYVSTTREVKRLNALALSPIFSHFNESLQGLQTIRAYKKQNAFADNNEHFIDQSNRAKWPLMAINRWLSVRLDVMSAFIVFITAMVVTVLMRTNAGLAGLALTSALNLTGLMNWLVRQTTQLEVTMNAIERITEYNKHDSEKDRIVEDNRPPREWPQSGAITVSNMWVRYRPDSKTVLKDVSFTVHPGEKIGVCGRTGSGKSTLMMALYRIVEPYEGTVYIDDLNVLEIGLHDLRSRLSLVPQDPVIFSGTIRSNLDPTSEISSDAFIWNALRQVGLHDYVSELTEQLSAEVVEGGQNLSVGQRQLLCMARALLRGSRILILDEATSNVDNSTDSVIQTTIRSAFQDCTILTIAHRLHTIIDYDRVMVLDDGYIAEFDTPQNLLANPESIFAGLVQEAGKKGSKRRTKSSVEFLEKVNELIKKS